MADSDFNNEQIHSIEMTLFLALAKLCKRWDLTDPEIIDLTGLNQDELDQCNSEKRIVHQELIERNNHSIVNLIGVDRKLTEKFDATDDIQNWLRTKHPDFKDSPLNLMLDSSEQIKALREYLNKP